MIILAKYLMTGDGKTVLENKAVFVEDGKTINLKYGKSLSSTGITATAQINAETFELLFKADKFLDLIQKLTDNTTNATLKTLGTLAGQYDAMKIGIELKK